MQLWFIFFNTNPKLERFDYTFTFVQVILKLILRFIDSRNVVTFPQPGNVAVYLIKLIDMLSFVIQIFSQTTKWISLFTKRWQERSTKRDYYTKIGWCNFDLDVSLFPYLCLDLGSLFNNAIRIFAIKEINPGNYSRLFTIIYYY